ncbi:MAG: EAL domain-containing protein [Mycobacterium sp.]
MALRLSLNQLVAVLAGAIILVFAVTISTSMLSQASVGRIVSDLENRLLPVRVKSSQLARAYLNQETGQRGFLLTGDPVTLAPYNSGTAEANRLVDELRTELSRAPDGGQLLTLFEDVVAAAATWREQAAEPQIAAQRAASITQEQLSPLVLDGKELFDKLRERAGALSTRIETLIAEGLQQLRSVQRTANLVQYSAAAALVVVIAGIVTMMVRMVNRPVARLVSDIRAVADGVYDSPIGGAGPHEVQVISTAVAAMRDSLIEARNIQKVEKKRFESVVGKTPSAVSVRDSRHRYTLVNTAFCQLFGYESAEEVIGRTEDEILPPDVLQRSRLAAPGLLVGDPSIEEESIQLGPDHTLFMTHRFPLRNAAGAITELVTIRTDITDSRKNQQEAAERAKWQDLVATAISEERLLVYSQPIVDVATKATVEEELLVRLRTSGAEEILPPSEFLPQCEQHGLMPVIDQYMVGRAIELARAGRQVSVNITGQTICDAKAIQKIIEALASAGPDVTDRITFEITENTALASPAVAKSFSMSMRGLGCRVALDDFGTGYGSFTELRHLDLCELKIDLTFVRGMLEDRDDERTVNTIVVVARAYGLTTIAEGVESHEVLERLAEMGVDRAQGYLFGRPAPVGT